MRILSKKEIIYLILLIVIVCYANFFTNSFTFEPIYSLYPDTVNLYFLQSLNDDSLFTDDLLSISIKNSLSVLNRSSAIAEIYRIFMYFFTLSVTMKVISILLCILATIVIYNIGTYLYSKNHAFLLSGLFLLYFLSMDSFYGGQSRCFGALIFCIFLFSFIKERFLLLPFLIPLAIFFYPSISVTLVIMCVLITFFFNKRLAQKKTYIVLLTIAIFISLIFGLGSSDIISKSALKNLSVFQDYKYMQGVNTLINPYNPIHILLYFVFNLNEHSRLYVCFTKFLIIACLIIIVLRKKEAFHLPRPIWIMLLASAGSFFAMYPFHPTSASRQFVFSMPLFLVFFVFSNVFNITRHKINPPILLAPIVLVFIILHPIFNDIDDYKKYKPLYDYMETLPKNTLIAGYPSSPFVETIPFFSKRAIFFADKMRDVLLFVYESKELQERRQLLVETIYADSLNEVSNFVLEYNIDYFLVESYLYEKSFIDLLKNSIFPEDRSTYNLIKTRKDKNDFPLLQFAKKYSDFKVEIDGYEIFVVSSKNIKRK